MRRIAVVLPVLWWCSCACAQAPFLSLASGSVVKGGSIALNLSLSVSSGSEPAGLQWALSYPLSDITSLNIVAGPALATGNKTLTCVSSAGLLNCLATGMNASGIGSGVVAVVTAAIAAGASSSSASIPLSNVMGVYSDGTFDTITASGGNLSLTNPFPAIGTLSPSVAVAGTAAFALAVTGTGFTNGSAVQWNGTPLTTTFGGATQLTATVPAAAIANAGVAKVEVINPGGNTSNEALFLIKSATRRSAPLPFRSRERLIDIFCASKFVAAGGHVICELRVTSTSRALRIALTSSSEHVRIPSAVVARAYQTGLSFQVAADLAAPEQFATVTATAGNTAVQETIQVQPSSSPVLSVPSARSARVGKALRFAVSAIDPAGLPVQLTASNVPDGAFFDATNGLFEWIPSSAQNGSYKVTFRAANSGGQSSSVEVAVHVGSGLPSLPGSERLVCSPAALASLQGSGLAELDSTFSDPTGNATVLGGTRVRINSEFVPVLFASDARVTFLCPPMETDTRLEAAIETGAGVSRALIATMQKVSPTIFSLDDSGEGQGMISFAGAEELATARSYLQPGHPAQPGDEILIWGTGFGLPAEAANGTVAVQLGGIQVEAESVRAVPGRAGVYTIQVHVPAAAGCGDAVPLQVQVTTPDGRQFSSNTVTMAVEPSSQ